MTNPSTSTTDRRNIAIISDTHIGCQLGLCHPDGAAFDNGGKYMPSKLQLTVWSYWQDYWKWIGKVFKGEPYDVVINGDIIDGVHHGATHQWTHNLTWQRRHAQKILEPIRRKCQRMYVVRGTPVHSGESAQDEESLARDLDCERNEAGQYSSNELTLALGDQLVHFAHHIGTTGSAAHEASAVNAELSAMFTEAGRWGTQAPTVIVRSHRHRCCGVLLPAENRYCQAFVTSSWQLKTPFAFKVAGGRTSQPTIGGSLIRLGDEDLYARHFTRHIITGRPR